MSKENQSVTGIKWWMLFIGVPLMTLLGTIIAPYIAGVIGSNTDHKIAIENAKVAIQLEKEKLQTELALEQNRFESTLILKAIETGNEVEAKKNLDFFLKAGFIEDPDQEIANFIENDDSIPVLPVSGGLTSEMFGCSIKGNISSSGERIYHVPRGIYYKRTVIDEESGERWFCAEEDALAAGWRKSVK